MYNDRSYARIVAPRRSFIAIQSNGSYSPRDLLVQQIDDRGDGTASLGQLEGGFVDLLQQ